jgi:3-methyladenine DNA glycosylase AlkC
MLEQRTCAEKLAEQYQRKQLAAQSPRWRQISKEHPQLLLQVCQQMRKPEQEWRKKKRAHLNLL